MTNELKNRIRDFIVSCDNTVTDFSSTADYDNLAFFLETAISLLEETLEEKQMRIGSARNKFAMRDYE